MATAIGSQNPDNWALLVLENRGAVVNILVAVDLSGSTKAVLRNSEIPVLVVPVRDNA